MMQGCMTLSLMLLLNMVSGFKHCPSQCLCYKSSDLVDCRFRGLVCVPPSVPHGIWMLDLSWNKLMDVCSRSFMGLWSLKILLMSNNSIQTLQSQSLSSLQFLERLDLSFNQLHGLPQDFSHRLSSLQELRLDHNLLQHLDSASLEDCENLRKLPLSPNHIRTLEVGAFSSLPLLSFLNLEGNRLSEPKDGLFSRQQNLEVLLLSHKNISVIETLALAQLQSLTLLGLQGNQLQHIGFKTFRQLWTTTTLLLMSSNPWTCDCQLQRVFAKIQLVRYLRVYDYRDITCHAPARHAGIFLASLESKLCVAETASVLVITFTLMFAVIGTLLRAEYNRKNKQSANESDKQEI